MICNNCGREIRTGNFSPLRDASQTPNPPRNQSAPSRKSSARLIVSIVAAVLGFTAPLGVQAQNTDKAQTNKDKFTEVTSAANWVRKQVELCFFDTQNFSKCNNSAKGFGWEIAAGSDYATRYIASIAVNNGVITAKAVDGDGLNGATFTIKPVSDKSNGLIDWQIVPEQSSCFSLDLCQTSSGAQARNTNKDRTNKDKFTEVTSAANWVRKQVELCFFDTQNFSKCNNSAKGFGWEIAAGSDYATRYIASIAVNNGVITAKAVDGDGLNGATFTIKPVSDDRTGIIDWQVVPEQSSCFSQDLCQTSSGAQARNTNKAPSTGKDKFTEVTSAAKGVRKQVELCFFDTQNFSKCNNNTKGGFGWQIYASGDYATRYVASITVNNGVITAKAVNGDGLNGATFTIKPVSDDRTGIIDWQVVPEQSSCLSEDLCR